MSYFFVALRGYIEPHLAGRQGGRSWTRNRFNAMMARLFEAASLLLGIQLHVYAAYASLLRSGTDQLLRASATSATRHASTLTEFRSEFSGVLDGMSWPSPPEVKDDGTDSAHSLRVKEIEGVRQRMILAQGTTVTIWGPEALTEEQLADQARSVQHMTRNADCFGMCACFCVMKPTDALPDEKGAMSSQEPKFTSDCFCKDKEGALLSKPLENKAADFYGNPLPKNKKISEIVRYHIPSSNYDVDDDGLILSLDAGDTRSYDPKRPAQWRDVSGSEGKFGVAGPLHGDVHGFVGFNESCGGGSLRFGAHGDRDVIVVPGLDVSPRKMPTLSVEVWVKLQSYPHSAGRVFGNSIDVRARGGRSLFLHNIIYGSKAHDPVPPRASDPLYIGKNGRAGASAGHLYKSNISPPNLNVWTQYVVVWTESMMTIYCDGIESAHESIYQDSGDVAAQGSSNFAIGNDEHSHTGGPSKLDGLIGLVRIWNRPLEPSDVDKLWKHSRDRFAESQ